MTETVKFEVPVDVVERWIRSANNMWEDDERDELYIDAVSCGNGDDTFASGEQQGESSAYNEILSYEVK